MSNAEKFELALAPLCGLVVFLSASLLPGKAGVGALVLWASALVLLQSLIRDLWLLTKQRSLGQPAPGRSMRCMCIESAVGATGVALGFGLLGAGIDHPVALSPWKWGFFVVVVLTAGFCLKDYVFTWSPFRVRRDKDHVNIVFTWKA